jgi:hypothetical protein
MNIYALRYAPVFCVYVWRLEDAGICMQNVLSYPLYMWNAYLFILHCFSTIQEDMLILGQ